MKRGDKVCIEKILVYINEIQGFFGQYSINSFEDLEGNNLVKYATTQIITNIYELKKKMSGDTLSNLPNFDKIKLSVARNIASHDYDEVNFSIIYIICSLLSKSKNELEEVLGNGDKVKKWYN